MNGKEHIVIAAFVLLAVLFVNIHYHFYPLSIWQSVISLLFGVFATTFVDVDHPDNKYHKTLGIVKIILIAVISFVLVNYDTTQYILWGIYFIVSWFFWWFMKSVLNLHHRGFIHSIVAGVIFSVVSATVVWYIMGNNSLFVPIFIGGFIGYYIHLILDGEFIKFW